MCLLDTSRKQEVFNLTRKIKNNNGIDYLDVEVDAEKEKDAKEKADMLLAIAKRTKDKENRK